LRQERSKEVETVRLSPKHDASVRHRSLKRVSFTTNTPQYPGFSPTRLAERTIAVAARYRHRPVDRATVTGAATARSASRNARHVVTGPKATEHHSIYGGTMIRDTNGVQPAKAVEPSRLAKRASAINGDLFISYAQSDGDLAATLLDLFRSAGVACFLAEKSIAAGTEWSTKLRTAIRRAKFVVVLLTPNSKNSSWVAAEIGAAWILRKALVPAVRDIAFAELEGPIQHYQGRQVATRNEMDTLVKEITHALGASGTHRRQPYEAGLHPVERFATANAWDQLLKVGQWLFDAKARQISGEGMYRYLLSASTYGVTAYRLDCRLRFRSLRPESEMNAVNAGILFGWSVPASNRRYVSLTLSGRSIFVELIGFRGRDDYFDFQHISDEIPFMLEPGVPYDFSLVVDGDDLIVRCNGSMLLRTSVGGSFIGRVGLRPWRSSMVCERFDVYALDASR
jgi:hypothetical protein